MADTDVKRQQALIALIPDQAGPWQAEAPEFFDSETIFSYIDGAGEVYRSYNFRYLAARRFHKDGYPDIIVDLFDMGSSEDAFGVFTHDLDGDELNIGQGSRYKGGQLSFWKGKYYVSIYAEEETAQTKEQVLELGRRISQSVKEEGLKPRLLEYFPAEGLDGKNIRFFHNYSVLNYHYFLADGDILKLEGKADAALANYSRGSDSFLLLIISYPAAKEAKEAQRSFFESYLPEAQGKSVIQLENGKWSGVRLRNNILAIIFDAGSGETAISVLDAVDALIAKKGK